ncbi:Predicted lipoprotein with conserved Yx(FWY)xxD motif [Haloechinothrix alba]|uniref:Predicted lipoprotein with conserved Yx(FWY)xxD motif n=1 Tax=Haloechinothrix alba TaxID=664784 RepID=A0A238YP44_9PSEU|nr:hypothetical protein [Haloechinothrix alba]SNR72189.1 Predicted lipoprotein with conserved Yx(FWY)xxD motif [Haloechinothrix alba]
MNRWRNGVVGVLSAAALTAALGACGEDGNGTDPGPQQEGTESAEATVATSDSEVGTILTDGQGNTLYLFTEDSPGTSACEDDCLQAWPTLEGEAAAGDGVDAELLDTIERPDGTVQATYNDWPLYYYAEDAESGDLNGQGVNDAWWVVDPGGNAIQQMPEGGSGY